MVNLYPEPEEIIRDVRSLYIQYKRALHDMSYFSNDQAYRKLKPEILEKVVQIEKTLLRYGYTVDWIETSNVIHWRLCAWNQGGLLRPWLLDRENPGNLEYIENWKNYAAPELLSSNYDWPSSPREDDKQHYAQREEIESQVERIGRRPEYRRPVRTIP